MSESARPRLAELESITASARRVRFGEIDVDDASARYAGEGYEVTGWLRAFIENYSELVVVWSGTKGGENQIDTTVDAALDASIRNVRIYATRVGRPVLPVGIAFATEETVLLADNGDILLAGDAGMQRIANGFEPSLEALLANTWDKTFF